MSSTVTVTGNLPAMIAALDAAAIEDGRVLKHYDGYASQIWTGSVVRVEDENGNGYDCGYLRPTGDFGAAELVLKAGRLSKNAIGRVVAAAL